MKRNVTKNGKKRPFARPNNKQFTRDSKHSTYAKRMDAEYEDVKQSGPRFGAPINDIKWYRDNEQLLNDVCRLPYNIPVGVVFNRSGALYPTPQTRWSIPGIACMNVVPTIGNAKSPSDPVNVAFHAMFEFIRSHTSSKFDWDPNTLAINTLATDSLYYIVRWATRAYATLPLFHNANRYLPKALLEAQGIDYDDFLANSASFRAALNMRISRINALKIPSEIYIFARHEWMFQNYYIEGASEKDQIYFYKPAAFYTVEFDSNSKRYLKCHRTLAGGTGTAGRLTAADIIRKIDAMLDPIYNDQDFALISGYIEQAYEGKVMHLEYLPDQMMLPLVYSEEVLLQFKNAKPMPVKHDPNGSGYVRGFFDIIQEPASIADIRLTIKTKTSNNALMVYRDLSTGQAVDVDNSSSAGVIKNMFAIADEYSKDIMLTTPHASVEAAENMINTRLIPVLEIKPSTGTSGFDITDMIFGTEWPISVELFTRYATGYNSSLSYTLQSFEYHRAMYFDQTAINAFIVVRTIFPIWTKFKYLPEMAVVTRNADETTDPDAVGPSDQSFFEIDNYCLINHEDIKRIHESAILCMLRVPEIASTSLNAR